MTLIAYSLLAFNLSILLANQVVESQHIPQTCQCPQVKRRVQGPFSDFKVNPKGPSCLQVEIIVTQRKKNSRVCLSSEDHQGKSLLKCWHRMQKAGMDHKKCLGRRKQQPRQKKRKQFKPKKVTS